MIHSESSVEIGNDRAPRRIPVMVFTADAVLASRPQISVVDLVSLTAQSLALAGSDDLRRGRVVGDVKGLSPRHVPGTWIRDGITEARAPGVPDWLLCEALAGPPGRKIVPDEPDEKSKHESESRALSRVLARWTTRSAQSFGQLLFSTIAVFAGSEMATRPEIACLLAVEDGTLHRLLTLLVKRPNVSPENSAREWLTSRRAAS